MHGFVLKGHWHYLEHDWVAEEGGYVYEPPGETHTLVVPDLLVDTPLLAALHGQVLDLPGIAAYLNSAQRYPMAGDTYVIDVASVLQRALPTHFPDQNKFVPVQ